MSSPCAERGFTCQDRPASAPAARCRRKRRTTAAEVPAEEAQENLPEEGQAEPAEESPAEEIQAEQAPETRAEEALAGQVQASAVEETPRRRGRRARADAEAQDETQPKHERVHADLLTVAYRGPLASKFRELAEQCHLSLARLLQDAMLRYEADVAGGYQPGTALAEWKGQQAQQATETSEEE